MVAELDTALEALARRREAPVLLYAATVAHEGLLPLYEYLRREAHVERLDVVLVTSGGGVVAARLTALLLREHVSRLSMLVPQHARSAGTLLCLAADELVLGPLSQLSPIDVQVGSAGSPAPDLPGLVGAEDVRAFPQMARDWFGVESGEDALNVLALVAQRIFPTSLSAFYRADQLVRRVAGELLALGQPALAAEERDAIVDALVAGRHGHDDALTRSDARALGLPVAAPQDEVERELWDLWLACREARAEGADGPPGLIAAPGFRARETRRWEGEGADRTLRVRWEVEQ